MVRKMVIDVDTGVDDAQALMMALADETVDVLAVTCVGGNTALDTVCRNTLRVLKACDKLQVPVIRGCERPILGKEFEATYHHGSDRLGGVPEVEPQAPSLDLLQPGHASNALVDLANKYPGEITLVTLAPLTNIATALKLDPNFGKKLKECVIMGGNIEGKGNTSDDIICAEFNFRVDPEAAYVTLNELGCPIKLLSFETCASTTFPWEWYLGLNSMGTKANFHKKITEYTVKRKKDILKREYYSACDPAAMAVALDPTSILDSKICYCSVELQGSWTRGQMIVDWRRTTKRTPNVQIITQLDIERIKSYYEKMLQ